MTNMKDANNEKSLTDCGVPGEPNSTNIDPVPKECSDDGWPSQKSVLRNPAADWKLGGPDGIPPPSQSGRRKLGLGQHGLCDPLQTGEIINDLDSPNRQVVYRYSRALRGANEAMYDMFRNVKVIDEDGKAHLVPITWATQEKAVGAMLQTNVRKDDSGVVDRIRLPTMAIYATGHTIDMQRFTYQQAQSFLPWLDPCEGSFGFTKREKYPRDTVFGVTRGLPVDISYNLYVWTMYHEDMDQILEQILLKFSPVAYIRVRGVWWEVIVTLDGTTNNFEIEPGDDKLRVLKYQAQMTAKTYIPQPITRYPMPAPLNVAGNLTDVEVRNAIEGLSMAMQDLNQ